MATRKVLFYELRPTRRSLKGWSFNATAFIAHLSSMPAESRKIFQGGSDTGMLAVPIHDMPRPAMRFCRCRRVGLPLIEQSGVMQPDRIGPNESRAEVTHMVFFDNNIVGAEFSRDGLRPSRLEEYLRLIRPASLPANQKIRVAPLYEKATLDRLDSVKEVRGAEIKFTPLLHEGSPVAGTLADQLASFASGFEGTKVGFTVSTGGGMNGSAIKAFFQNAFSSHSVTVAKARVRLDNDEITTIDLIQGHIGREREMALEGGVSGSVTPESAYTNIVQVYSDVQTELVDALAAYQEEPEPELDLE